MQQVNTAINNEVVYTIFLVAFLQVAGMVVADINESEIMRKKFTISIILDFGLFYDIRISKHNLIIIKSYKRLPKEYINSTILTYFNYLLSLLLNYFTKNFY